MKKNKTYLDLTKEIELLTSENEQLRIKIAEKPCLENELCELLSHLGFGLVLIGIDKTIKKVNPKFSDFFHITDTDALIGRKFDKSLKIASTQFNNPIAFINQIKKNLKENIESKDEIYHLKDGRAISISTFILSKSQSNNGILCLCRDITPINREIEKINSRWKYAIEAINDGLWDWDASTNEVYFSAQWKKMLGYLEPEIKNDLSEWKKRVHQDDLDKVYKELNKHLDGQVAEYRSEHRVKCKDGTYKWILDRGKVIEYDTNNKPKRVIGTHCDITQRKNAENELEATYKTLEDERHMFIQGNVVVFKWKNMPGRPIEYVSPNVKCILGYPLEEINNTQFKFTSIIHPDDVEVFTNTTFSSRHRCCNTFEHKPYRIKKNDGSYISVHDYTIIIRDDNNEITHYLGYLIDITDFINTKNELLNKEKELQELNNTKDKFLSIIAHDLKSPFSTLVSYSNLLVDSIHENDYKDIEKYGNIIKQSSERTMQLTNNLLKWARSQTNNIRFAPCAFNFNELILEEIENIKDVSGQKNITMVPLIDKKTEVFADKNMVQTVVRNLLSNAVKYSNNNGIISISTLDTKTDIQISIQDNGTGIKEKNIEKLFRIDQSFTTEGTNKEKGTGLGLILCKEFIEKHKGRIWVKSEYSRGSIFTFTIPKK